MKKFTPKEKKARVVGLLDAALPLAAAHGYRNVTRAMLATECGVAEALVSYYLGTMPELRRALMRHAVHVGHATIVLQGLADGNPYARKAPTELRAAALATA